MMENYTWNERSIYLATDKDVLHRWLSDLAGDVITTYLQRQREDSGAQPSSRATSPRGPERLERPVGPSIDAPARFDSAIAGLPRQQRIILALRDHGLTYEEIASHLGLPVGTVHSRIFRARRRVRRQDRTPLARRGLGMASPRAVRRDPDDSLWRDAIAVE